MSNLTEMQGSFRTPSFEHARVSDAMRSGVISCPPDVSWQTLAQIMVTNHVHAVVVTSGGDAPLGVVSDRELLRALHAGAEEGDAGSLATDPVTAFADDSLRDATRTLIENQSSHLIVVSGSGQPLGVLSTLDVAGIAAWGMA